MHHAPKSFDLNRLYSSGTSANTVHANEYDSVHCWSLSIPWLVRWSRRRAANANRLRVPGSTPGGARYITTKHRQWSFLCQQFCFPSCLPLFRFVLVKCYSASTPVIHLLSFALERHYCRALAQASPTQLRPPA